MRRISSLVFAIGSIAIVCGACGGSDSGDSPGDPDGAGGGPGSDAAGNPNGPDGAGPGTDGATGDGASKNDGGEGGTSTSPVVSGCAIFPATDAWNTKVTGIGVDAAWTTKLFANATSKNLHPDFGSNFGIPFNLVPANQAKLTMAFSVMDESDPGPYPFPGATAKVEAGTPGSCAGDCHVLALQSGTCDLYEGDACHYNAGASTWSCFSGAKFDLSKPQTGNRPLHYTSADAAGLSIFAGLIRYDEVAAGEIRHAIRFTMHCTQDGFVPPASHQAVPNQCPPGITNANLRAGYPPMGTRVRLKSTFNVAALPAQAKVIAVAMQTYGLLLADNGSDYYFQGDPNPSWDDSQLNALKAISGDQFEVLTMPVIQR